MLMKRDGAGVETPMDGEQTMKEGKVEQWGNIHSLVVALCCWHWMAFVSEILGGGGVI